MIKIFRREAIQKTKATSKTSRFFTSVFCFFALDSNSGAHSMARRLLSLALAVIGVSQLGREKEKTISFSLAHRSLDLNVDLRS